MGGKFSIRRIIILRSMTLMQKFPEDIECVVEPRSGRGGLYISNIEVAENPRTLESTTRSIQGSASRL
jgi:hypothetical protein